MDRKDCLVMTANGFLRVRASDVEARRDELRDEMHRRWRAQHGGDNPPGFVRWLHAQPEWKAQASAV